MIIVALVATLAGSMVWQQWRAIQVEAAERARAQSAWILSGALDWARLILREDAKRDGGIDHLGEPWAVPLAEARLSTFLAADKDNTDDAPDAFLSGAITDAMARYNLTNLLDATGRIDPLEVASSSGCATRSASRPTSRRASPSACATRRRRCRRRRARAARRPTPPADPPLMPRSVSQLGWLGIDAESLRAARALRRPHSRHAAVSEPASSTSTRRRAKCSSPRSPASTSRRRNGSSSRASACR